MTGCMPDCSRSPPGPLLSHHGRHDPPRRRLPALARPLHGPLPADDGPGLPPRGPRGGGGRLPPLLPPATPSGAASRWPAASPARSTTSRASTSRPRTSRTWAGSTGNDGRPLFDPAFLRELGALRLRCDVDAVPEGTVVFPYEPLVRVRGPILHAQLVETALLNFVNFETLIATKAARVCLAARGDEVIDFGLRRAQGPDGGLSASRAAYVGGCSGTSNVLAGRLFGLPVRGTHAHSWVMAFDTELEAFEAWARAQPNNCVFLVDTYDTLEGVRHAAEVALRLRRARARADRDPPRLRRPRLPEHRGAEDPRRGGPPGGADRGQQRPRRAPDREPQGAGREDRRLGRGDAPRHREATRPRSAGSTSWAPCASRAGPGSTGSRSRSRRRRPPTPGCSR